MEYSIEDLKSNVLAKLPRPEAVEKVVVFILESAQKTDSNKAMSTDEIQKAYQKLQKDNEDIICIPEKTIATTISILSKKADSRIQCKGRKQGYFVSPIINSVEDSNNDEESVEQPRKGKLAEKDLYPLVKLWIESFLKSFKAIDISGLRGGLKWRNPDLLGVKEIDFLGNEQFEILTIEVKPSMQDWTMYIFEAVSHSLFSNRTYFAYLKDNYYEKVPDEMKLYALKFGIGIISIAIDEDQRQNIRNSTELLKALEDNQCEIKEEVPAPFHVPDIDLQKKFLDGLDIHTKTDLRKFQ